MGKRSVKAEGVVEPEPAVEPEGAEAAVAPAVEPEGAEAAVAPAVEPEPTVALETAVEPVAVEVAVASVALQTARIDRWGVFVSGAKVRLVGCVSGHPRVNGADKTTGWIERVEGDRAYSRRTCWALGPEGEWDALRSLFAVGEVFVGTYPPLIEPGPGKVV